MKLNFLIYLLILVSNRLFLFILRLLVIVLLYNNSLLWLLIEKIGLGNVWIIVNNWLCFCLFGINSVVFMFLILGIWWIFGIKCWKFLNLILGKLRKILLILLIFILWRLMLWVIKIFSIFWVILSLFW